MKRKSVRPVWTASNIWCRCGQVCEGIHVYTCVGKSISWRMCIHVLFLEVARVFAAQRQARGTGSTTYASPSWHYAAHPRYPPLHKGPAWPQQPEAFQMLFECEVRRGSYSMQRGSLASKHWNRTVRMDPERDSVEGLEFLMENAWDVQLTSVMFRKLGETIDETTFGPWPQRPLDLLARSWTFFVWTSKASDKTHIVARSLA